MEQTRASTTSSGKGYTSCSSHKSVICQQTPVSHQRPYLLPTDTCLPPKALSTANRHLSPTKGPIYCQQTPVSHQRPYLLPTHPHPLLFPPLLMYCTTSILSHFFLYPGDESAVSSKTSVNFYHGILCHITEDPSHSLP